MTFPLELVGTISAFAGAILSIIGALYNNLAYRHTTAMEIWMVSNVLLLGWSIGYVTGLWNGALSGVALIAMYLIFTVSNLIALIRKRKHIEGGLG